MAFLLLGATRMAVRGVKDGVQAFKDAKNPDFGTGQEREVEVDRWGNPKKSGAVYDFVLKNELKRKAKSTGSSPATAIAGPSSAGNETTFEREYRPSMKKPPVKSEGEDYGPQDYSSKGWNTQNETQEDAPPAYVETPSLDPSTNQPRGAFGPAPPSAYSPAPVATDATRPGIQRQNSLSSLSSSSSSSSSSSEGHSRSGQGMGSREARKTAKKERRAQKKWERNQRRALKREHRDEKERMKAQHRYEKEMAKSGVMPTRPQ